MEELDGPASEARVDLFEYHLHDRPNSGGAPNLPLQQLVAYPATGDEGDDAYTYGFRLWAAAYILEAQLQLESFLENHAAHWRATYARNLLGRTLLESGQPRKAAGHFLENYRADQNAARAPDSLLYFARSMIELGEYGRACLALSRFKSEFSDRIRERLADLHRTITRDASCP